MCTFSDTSAGRITWAAAHLGRIRPVMGAGGYTGGGEAGVSAKNSDKIKKTNCNKTLDNKMLDDIISVEVIS